MKTVVPFSRFNRWNSFLISRIPSGSRALNPYFYEKMTARQNLELHCEYMGFPNRERIDEVLQMVGLQEVRGKQVRHFSLGMKQRLAIARAVLAYPEFLMLDEPINALDPEGIREMRKLFQRLNRENGTEPPRHPAVSGSKPFSSPYFFPPHSGRQIHKRLLWGYE